MMMEMEQGKGCDHEDKINALKDLIRQMNALIVGGAGDEPLEMAKPEEEAAEEVVENEPMAEGDEMGEGKEESFSDFLKASAPKAKKPKATAVFMSSMKMRAPMAKKTSRGLRG